MVNKRIFADKIVEWYRANRRNLPWRETGDPYKIWLSEIILQQTRVAQGIPYYLKFIERFPDVFALAGASEEEVLRSWQGLGYYSRARNLHRSAKIVSGRHGGMFPGSFERLLTLPGIGAYTAAAIASIAFGERVAAIDGNAYRVLSRVYGIEIEINSSAGKSHFKELGDDIIPPDAPGDFNQAVMEFGATHCLPRNPLCEDCIFKKQCVSFARGLQDRLPAKARKPAVRKRYFYYFVLEKGRKILMQKRIEKDIWQGLYDFYLVETKRPRKPELLLETDPLLQRMKGKIRTGKVSGLYKHLLTHQKLLSRFIRVTVRPSRGGQALFKSKSMKFYSSKEIEGLPKPELISRYLSGSDF